MRRTVRLPQGLSAETAHCHDCFNKAQSGDRTRRARQGLSRNDQSIVTFNKWLSVAGISTATRGAYETTMETRQA